MRKKISVFLVLIGLISFGTFVSCKKEKGIYTLEGTITDNTFGQSIAGQLLTVSLQNAGSTSYITHSTITTDANGKYHVEIERGEIDKIKISGTKKNYFGIEFVVPISVLTVGDTYIINQGITAQAWARLIFKHTTGSSSTQLNYIKVDGKQGCAECCPISQQTYLGYVNDTVYCINDGNTNYSYNYTITGTTIFENKVCYTPAFDTAELILNY
jgi:hypothetical protein